MILVGNQRGGAHDLALHLMKDENDHVNVHEMRGFVSDDLEGALQEAYAISRATKCKQFLFSLSLNPPPNVEVSTQEFESAIERVETDLGLNGQPRAIVFHEKEGADGKVRRHAHAVWSRIDAEEMKAKQLSYSHMKLQEVARDLYLEHGWKMPEGLSKSGHADPRNFTHAQWQQARRQDKDPRELKTAMRDAWAISDSKVAFTHALQERGLYLARGDRRGFVAIDSKGEVYSLPKWAGVKTKDVRARLGEESALPSVSDTKAAIAKDMTSLMDRFEGELDQKAQAQKAALEKEKQELLTKQHQQRAQQKQLLEARQQAEAVQRQERFRTGVKAAWDHIRGEHKRIQKRNELEAYQALKRDQTAKDELIFSHIEQRNTLNARLAQDALQVQQERQEIAQEREAFNVLSSVPSPPKRPPAPTIQKEPHTAAPAFNKASQDIPAPLDNQAERKKAFKEQRRQELEQAQNRTRPPYQRPEPER